MLKNNNIEGKAIEVLGDLVDMNAVYRSQGWHEVEKARGQWETIVQVPTEWKAEKFRSGVVAALAAHPEANCMFVASDFCFSAVELALEEAGRLAPTGDPKHVWIAAQDVNPQGYDAMLNGYIDVATTYDAYFHAVEAIWTIVPLALGETGIGTNHLVPGRVATPDTVADMPYMWAKDYKD